MVDMTNILVINNNNYFLSKNNVEYAQARFMQASQIIKRLMIMFFAKLNLAFMQKYLNYKNIN